ncbi:hypothetical protein HNQ56_003381 [Anaerotaenia torta]|uniref:DUF2804 domain-containing protein n=1 Tax=Anaerotaenia torta TaxID=433293 RepID=UPI003D2411C9
MTQIKFEKPGPVLDKKGSPYPGYSTESILTYRRKAIKASCFRIKEWDFYQITDRRMCLQFTIGHAAYAGQAGIMFFDFERGERLAEKGTFLVLPFGSLHLPEDAEKDHVVRYEKKGGEIFFEVKGDVRRLYCKWEDFEADVTLTRQNRNSLVINIPFDESPTAFYYNHKINCMPAEGVVRYGEKQYCFSSADSYGLLDWGRGVWPFHNEWYWSNGTGLVNNRIFGFNLGCGFGNTSHATENILFYGDDICKLGEVSFELGSDYMCPWHIHDTDGKLDLVLTPRYDRTTKTKLLWVDNCCHQMFGEFTGRAVLEDGTELKIEKLVSFAEYAVNNW